MSEPVPPHWHLVAAGVVAVLVVLGVSWVVGKVHEAEAPLTAVARLGRLPQRPPPGKAETAPPAKALGEHRTGLLRRKHAAVKTTTALATAPIAAPAPTSAEVAQIKKETGIDAAVPAGGRFLGLVHVPCEAGQPDCGEANDRRRVRAYVSASLLPCGAPGAPACPSGAAAGTLVPRLTVAEDARDFFEWRGLREGWRVEALAGYGAGASGVAVTSLQAGIVAELRAHKDVFRAGRAWIGAEVSGGLVAGRGQVVAGVTLGARTDP